MQIKRPCFPAGLCFLRLERNGNDYGILLVINNQAGGGCDERHVPLGVHGKKGFYQVIRRALDYVFSHPECQEEDPEVDAWCDKVIEVIENAKNRLVQ